MFVLLEKYPAVLFCFSLFGKVMGRFLGVFRARSGAARDSLDARVLRILFSSLVREIKVVLLHINHVALLCAWMNHRVQSNKLTGFDVRLIERVLMESCAHAGKGSTNQISSPNPSTTVTRVSPIKSAEYVVSSKLVRICTVNFFKICGGFRGSLRMPGSTTR